MKYINILLLLILISCTQREDDIKTQINPFDPSGDNWITSQPPKINFIGSDTLYWRNFNFQDSTGNVLLPVLIEDVDGNYDSISLLLTISTELDSMDTIDFVTTPEGILIDSLKPFSSYYLNLLAIDSKGASDTLDTLINTPNGYPPIIPESLSISANFSNISINWLNNPTNDTIVIFKTNHLDSQFVQVAQVFDTTTANISDNSYSVSYYLVGSKNKFGMNISNDTLISKSYSEICTINPYWNNSPATSSITIEWYYLNTNEVAYFEIFRSEYPDKHYSKIAEVLSQTSSDYNYTDYTITSTNDYYYKISYVLKNGGSSSFSQYTSGYIIRLDPPLNINVSKGTYGKNILVTWDPVFKAKKYGIFRCFQPDNYIYLDTILLDTTLATNQYIDNPPSDTNFTYAVYAIDSLNNKGALAWANSSGYSLKYAKNFMIDTNYITDSTINLKWDFQQNNYNNSLSIIMRFSDSLMSDTIIDTVSYSYMYNIMYKDTAIDTNYSTYYYKVAQLDTANKFFSTFTSLLSAKAAPKPIYRDSIKVTNYPNSAILSWNVTKGADNYLIYRSPTNSYNKSDYSFFDSTSDTTVTINNLTDSIYYYKILAKNSSSKSKWISEYGIEVKALSIPDSGYIFSSSVPSGIQIYFNNFNYATSYNLYRSTDTLNNYTYIKNSDTSFFIDTVTTTDKYFYKVTGVNLSGEGKFSNIVSGSRTKPGNALNLKASQGTLAADNVIHVTWDTIAGADTVYILRAESNQYGTYNIIDTIIEQEYFDTVTTDSLFFYKVRGKNVVGFGNESSPSNGGFRKPSSVPDSVINVSTYSGYSDRIRINWQISSTGSRANGFIVYRLDNDSIVSNIEQNPLDTIEATGNSSYSYYDQSGSFSPVGFGKHWYVVKSFNIIGLSPPSEPVYGNIQ